MFINGQLESAQFELYTTGTLPAASTKPYQVVYLTDTNKFLISDGANWSSNTVPPTIQRLASAGVTTGYVFTITSASATTGATYTNNGNTYTVVDTIAASTFLWCNNAAAPLSSGTLTKTSGTGDASITFSSALAVATYTTPVGTSFLEVEIVGGGAGGGTAGNNGTAGVTSYFGSGVLIAGGGGVFIGGTNTINAPAITVIDMAGGDGRTIVAGGGGGSHGPSGGISYFGGGGEDSASANSGSGGAGADSGGGFCGGSGGAGGYIKALLLSPLKAAYPYSVAPSTSGSYSVGGSGVIIVTEHS